MDWVGGLLQPKHEALAGNYRTAAPTEWTGTRDFTRMFEQARRRPLRIAQVAPLHESVPAQLYGGTERMVAYLAEELMRRGTKARSALQERLHRGCDGGKPRANLSSTNR
jgi:hypothetical protein